MKHFAFNLKHSKSKGFTLIEMLIVVVIIGILSGMITISAGNASDKASAVKIVAEMRTLKTAAVMYYADNNAWPTATTFDGSSSTSYDKYIGAKIPKGYGYEVEGSTVSIVCDSASYTKMSEGVREKLQDMAAESQLLNAVSGDTAYKKESAKVYMRVR